MNTIMKFRILSGILITTIFAFNSLMLYGQDRGKTITECIDIAFNNNPELKFQEMKIREAESKYLQQIGNLLPQIDTSLSYNRFEKELPSKKVLIGESLDDYYADISLRQILFSGGKYVLEKDIARISLDAETAKYEQLKRQVKLSVEKAYYELLRTIHTVRNQKELSMKLKEQLQISQLLYNSGKISNLDVLIIETQAALSEDMINNLENLVYTKSLLLAQTMGIKEPVTIQEDIPEIRKNIKINTYCLHNNFKDHPELNYAQNLQEKSQVEIKVAKSELFPSIFFRANYNIENGDWYLADPSWSNWYVGVGITIPLFHGGSIHARVDQALARYEQISETKRRSEINIKVRFESARSNLIYQASHFETTQRILDLAKEALTTAELKYNSGKLSAIELIDAEMVWNNAQNNYINDMINYLIATAEIEAICLQAIAK